MVRSIVGIIFFFGNDHYRFRTQKIEKQSRRRFKVKFINKSVFVLIGLLCFLSWMAYSPSMVLAAKAGKTVKV